jgi:hypothetical protein
MPSQPDPQEQPSDRPSLLTLAVASASSVVAAVLVSKLWGPGTIIGAAATPVIVTFVAELLKKPAGKITVVRVSPSGTQVHERTAPAPSAPASPPAGAAPEPGAGRSRRPLFALATGLVAFVIGAFVLTSSELVFGDSSVASGGKRTTIFSGPTQERPPPAEQAPQGPTPSVETTTVPAPTAPPERTVTETAPARTAPAEPGTSGPTGAVQAPGTGATEP